MVSQCGAIVCASPPVAMNVAGLPTNLGQLLAILSHPDVRAGNARTTMLTEHPELMASESKRIETPLSAPPVKIHEVIPPLAQAIAERHKRPADLKLDLKPADLLAPEDNFKKILEELIDNGFKFSEPGKPVTISSEMAEHTLKLTVTDQGRGFTAEQIARIAPHMQFERKTYEQQGAGLGLTIAKRLTELLGGHLTIESKPGIETSLQVSFEVPWR